MFSEFQGGIPEGLREFQKVSGTFQWVSRDFRSVPKVIQEAQEVSGGLTDIPESFKCVSLGLKMLRSRGRSRGLRSSPGNNGGDRSVPGGFDRFQGRSRIPLGFPGGFWSISDDFRVFRRY